MASSVASAAARKCRALVFCTSHRLKEPSLSFLRQQLASRTEQIGGGMTHHAHQCKRSLYSMHEQGRRTKSTTTTTKPSETVGSNQSQPERDSDLVVVLDLDECLVHSKFLNSAFSAQQQDQYAFQVLQHYSQQQQQQQQESMSGSNNTRDQLDTFHIALPDGDLARVHQRPFLQDFLKEVSSKYETHLFTAGKQVYAESVLRHLDPDGTIFTKCLHRDDCTYDPLMKAYVKDLGQHFGDTVHKTVLVDNNHLSFLANPQNGILVTNFFDDPNDTTLLAVLDLLEELAPEDDVRPILEDRFGLTEFLKRRQEHEEVKYYGKKQTKKEQRDKVLESTEQLMINVSV